MDRTAQDATTIKPHFWPRDSEDALISAGIGILQLSVLYLLPSLVIGIGAGVVTQSCGLGVIAGVSTYGSIYAIWLSLTVWSAAADPTGLHFRRLFGKPKALAWAQITSVTPASRRELIVHGWLWPPFPAREMTPSLTSLGHYRISWATGFCYYPPADPVQFDALVRAHVGGAA